MFAYAVLVGILFPQALIKIQQTYKVGMCEDSQLKSFFIALARSKNWTYSSVKGGILPLSQNLWPR